MKFKPFPELTNILLPKQCETYGEISVYEFNRMTPFDGMMEWRNGEIFYNAECLVV